MTSVVKQYNFTKKELTLKRYSNWFEEVDFGFLNGSDDIKSMGLMVLKTGAVPQRRSGEKLPIIWLKRFSPSEKNWNLTGLAVLLFPELGPRLFIGSLNKERSVKFLLSLLLPKSSLVMEKLVELSPKEMAISSLILTLRQRRWETSIRQTLWAPDISEGQKGLSDFILFILWMWQAIRASQVSSLINRLSPCADIWLKHGEIWGFRMYLRWIMRWLPQGADATPTASPKLFVCTWFWASIWYSSHRENQVEMPRWRVLMDSGKRGCLEDIIALPLPFSKESANDSCGITIMRNHTGVLLKKNMAQDSLGYLEIAFGNPLDICQRVLSLKDISIPMDILISLLPREESPLSERLTLMVKLMLMALLISSGENLRVNMLLLLSLLIEKDCLLNKKIRLSSPSLSQLRGISLLLCFHIQREKLDLVCDVIRLLSIRN